MPTEIKDHLAKQTTLMELMASPEELHLGVAKFIVGVDLVGLEKGEE